MIFNFTTKEAAMARRVLTAMGLLVALVGTAAAQRPALTPGEKIEHLQRQMLEMQRELDALKDQQRQDAAAAKKRQEESTQQLQTAREQLTEQTLSLLERVKIGGDGSVRVEGGYLNKMADNLTFPRFVLTTDAQHAPPLPCFSGRE